MRGLLGSRKLLFAALLAFCAVSLEAISFPFIFPIFGRRPHARASQQGSIPGQTAEIAGLKIVPAAQKCENWSWAASMVTSLGVQGVKMRQNDLVLRAYGGEVCKDSAGDFEQLAKVTDGVYHLEDGRKVRLEMRNVTGAPTVVDDLIMATRRGRPVIFFWKEHAYPVQAVVYDEIIGPNGYRIYQINELKLLDPFQADPGKQAVSFRRDQNDPAEISGVMDVVVTPVTQQEWLHPEKELEHPSEIQFPK